MISSLVNLINESIKTKAFPSLYDAQYYGITEMIPTTTDAGNKLVPTIVDEFGDGIEMAIDSEVSLQVYYRLTNKQTKLNKYQYGDSNKELTDSYTMSMYVIGNRKRLKENASEVSYKISSWMPDVFKENSKAVAFLTQNSVDFNAVGIIGIEFNNTDFNGLPDMYMFRHDFNISHTYRRKCLDACEIVCTNFSTN